MFVIFSVFYILIATAMIVLILIQRGAGAEAGSGFGAGASATVFGARGSSNFLTRATGVLAALFFLLSLGMGVYMSRGGHFGSVGSSVMDSVPAIPTAGSVPQPTAPNQAAGEIPAPTGAQQH